MNGKFLIASDIFMIHNVKYITDEVSSSSSRDLLITKKCLKLYILNVFYVFRAYVFGAYHIFTKITIIVSM